MDIRDELTGHVPRLRRYARALINNRELADDLVQDTLERALGRTELFRAGTDLRAWLFTIMHNLFVNQVRKSSSRGAHVPVGDEGVPAADFAIPASQLRTLEVRDLDYALHVGLRMLTLRRLVDEADGLYRARPNEARLLAYYANSMAHLLG
jgi:RNA polymerase sigma-70 factor (ECF subfamily)